MSNLFKANSRFSCLIDSETKKDFKRENSNTNNFNSFKNRDAQLMDREYQREEREQKIILQREFEEKEKKRKEEEKDLNIINFPELVINIKKDEIKKDSKISYSEKLKKLDEEIIKSDIDPDLENLKAGWMLFKRDPLTGRTIIKHNKIKSNEVEKSEYEIVIEVMEKLAKLHEKRTEEYIEQYGYDTWEKMFKCPNWREEENYFDDEEDEDEDEEDESNIVDMYHEDNYY